ncbi:MAG TPA: hypothetical protein VHG51_20555 [Longimicrobiaceae bacterium]|nr:hypothetical protein [Longimicrobiaceae bacterium]
MPFGLGDGGTLFMLLVMIAVWAVPIALAVWFVRTMNDVRRTQREIADRLARIEHRVPAP